jgi:1-acyl-sn-glycerol-3-phosphate acyltransferase
MRVARAILFTLYFYLLTGLVSIVAVPLLLAPPLWLMVYGRWWVAASFWGLKYLVGLDYRIEGREHLPSGPFIIAAKHQSAWDTMIYRFAIANMAPVMKRELAYIPVWGWLVKHAGAITVDRGGGAQALKRLISDAKLAKSKGRRILIFPEGTRVSPGEHKSFLPGVAALYANLDLPVVPVAVNSGVYWPRRVLFGQRPGTITLRFLPAIQPGSDRRAFMERLESDIRSASDTLIEPDV